MPDEPARPPPVLHRAEVRPEWLDYNGHLNEAYYLLIFSHATDALLDRIGMDDAFRRREGVTIFTLETHLCYLREVGPGETVEVEVRVLGLDAKRAHLFHAMRRTGEPEVVAATAEMVILHVDAAARRGAPFRPDALAALRALEDGRPRPEQAGRSVGLGRGPTPAG
jgi:acyl-CoA thioester hydrolase